MARFPQTGGRVQPQTAAFSLQRGKHDMVFEPEDTNKVRSLLAGWNETMIASCLQKVMGKVYVTDLNNPKSALAFLGCFGFFAGEPDRELLICKPGGLNIIVPQSEEWGKLTEEVFPTAKRVTRYATKKNTVFDRKSLEMQVAKLPKGYRLLKIDSQIYDKCLSNPVTRDFVSSFNGKDSFLKNGRGVVIEKDGEIVSGASSYSRYPGGIEIEVDTMPCERRKNLAAAACATLILSCLDEGLYPSWDAQNLISVHLAEKLGYEVDHAYTAYEVTDDALMYKGKNDY